MVTIPTRFTSGTEIVLLLWVISAIAIALVAVILMAIILMAIILMAIILMAIILMAVIMMAVIMMAVIMMAAVLMTSTVIRSAVPLVAVAATIVAATIVAATIVAATIVVAADLITTGASAVVAAIVPSAILLMAVVSIVLEIVLLDILVVVIILRLDGQTDGEVVMHGRTMDIAAVFFPLLVIVETKEDVGAEADQRKALGERGCVRFLEGGAVGEDAEFVQAHQDRVTVLCGCAHIDGAVLLEAMRKEDRHADDDGLLALHMRVRLRISQDMPGDGPLGVDVR